MSRFEMRNWFTGFVALLLLVVVGIYAISYLYGRSLRFAGIIEGKMHLRNAAKVYAVSGYVTNYGASYQVWLTTNSVTVGGTQYQCFLTARVSKFYDLGSLAMTTNGIFIWLDAERPPKVIGSDYRPPLFPPRF